MDANQIIQGAIPGQDQRSAFLRTIVKRAAKARDRGTTLDVEARILAWQERFPGQPPVTGAERDLVAKTLWFVS